MGKYKVLKPHQRRASFQRFLPGSTSPSVVPLSDGTVIAVANCTLHIYRVQPQVRVVRTLRWNTSASEADAPDIRDARLLADGRTLVIADVAGGVALVDTLGNFSEVPPVFGRLDPAASRVDVSPSEAFVPVRFPELGDAPCPSALPLTWGAAALLADGRVVGHSVDSAGRYYVHVRSPTGEALATHVVPPGLIDDDVSLGPLCTTHNGSIVLIAETNTNCIHAVDVVSGRYLVALVADKLRLNDAIRVTSICVTYGDPRVVVLSTTIGRSYALESDATIATLLHDPNAADAIRHSPVDPSPITLDGRPPPPPYQASASPPVLASLGTSPTSSASPALAAAVPPVGADITAPFKPDQVDWALGAAA